MHKEVKGQGLVVWIIKLQHTCFASMKPWVQTWVPVKKKKKEKETKGQNIARSHPVSLGWYFFFWEKVVSWVKKFEAITLLEVNLEPKASLGSLSTLNLTWKMMREAEVWMLEAFPKGIQPPLN
jgi:hypothetical protein